MLSCIIFTILLFSLTTQHASAWTFEERSNWFGTGSGFEVANIAVTFTYPDRLEAGQPLDALVILEYIDNQMANANFAVFSDIQVHLRDLSERKKIGTTNGNNYTHIKEYEPSSIYSSDKNNSGVIGKGEQYMTKLSLPTNGLEDGLYSVDLSFRAFFSLGNSIAIYPWDSMWYLGEGALIEDQLPPITIVQKEHDNNNRELGIAIMQPHGIIKPVTISINGTAYNTIDGRIKVGNLTGDADYEVTIPEEISLVDNEIRAVFNKWSDGNTSPKSSIFLDKNKELFAIYDTQYRLTVRSSLDNRTLFDGWKNNGEQVQFSVDPAETLKGATNLKGFVGWIGDAYGSDRAISFSMDRPKEIIQVWEFDSTIVGIFAGVSASAATIVKERRHIAHLFSWLRERV